MGSSWAGGGNWPAMLYGVVLFMAAVNGAGGSGEWGPDDGYSPGGCTVDIWSM